MYYIIVTILWYNNLFELLKYKDNILFIKVKVSVKYFLKLLEKKEIITTILKITSYLH